MRMQTVVFQRRAAYDYLVRLDLQAGLVKPPQPRRDGFLAVELASPRIIAGKNKPHIVGVRPKESLHVAGLMTSKRSPDHELHYVAIQVSLRVRQK
jgi:hypothetical protein